MLHRFTLIPLTVALILVACSQGVRDAAPAPTVPDPLAAEPWHPPVAHQRCEAVDARIASVGALADSAAIVAASAGASGHALWTITFDGNGLPADVRVLESTLPDGDADILAAVVRRSLRTQDGERYVRLRLDADAASARLRVGGVQYCHATLLNVDAVRLAMGAIDRDGVVELELYIDQQGTVQERELKTSSGVDSTDRMVVGLVSGMQYAPALLERRAVPSRLAYRVDLEGE